ncbi:unnamed protein product [Larinioides sclopetarius]|uniref:Uncharacterized protein n=1 Tax=Larinioides sclopetarius TaxID=280406 RepID=A0AAV1ZQB1_9ARAC
MNNKLTFTYSTRLLFKTNDNLAKYITYIYKEKL